MIRIIKKVYRKFFKTPIAKLKLTMGVGAAFDSRNLPSKDEARNILESAYSVSHKKTNYNEKFFNEPSLDISIIVPVYNVEKFLPKCIESLMSQNYESMEIILVDDGSPDNSGKICDEYAKKDKRIKVIHTKNLGVSNARNAGIINSRGKNIMFVDSDDYLEPTAIETLIKPIDKFEIVQGLYQRVKDNKIIYKSKLISTQKIKNFSTEYGFVWGKIYKREIFENIKFPLAFWYEDMISDLVITPGFLSKTIVNHIVYNYRVNSESITANQNRSLKIFDTYFVLEEIMLNFDKFKVNFSTYIFKRFMFQASTQMFVRINSYDEKYVKGAFVLACELYEKIIAKYNISKNELGKYDKKLMKIFETKNFAEWKLISLFYK